MKLPGYWVSAEAGRIFLTKTTFDETELDPATSWKQAWQNQDEKGLARGYVELGAALMSAAALLASAEGRELSGSDLEQAGRYEPVWLEERCEIPSIASLLGAGTS